MSLPEPGKQAADTIAEQKERLMVGVWKIDLSRQYVHLIINVAMDPIAQLLNNNGKYKCNKTEHYCNRNELFRICRCGYCIVTHSHFIPACNWVI
jgi:hypothetical protein